MRYFQHTLVSVHQTSNEKRYQNVFIKTSSPRYQELWDGRIRWKESGYSSWTRTANVFFKGTSFEDHLNVTHNPLYHLTQLNKAIQKNDKIKVKPVLRSRNELLLRSAAFSTIFEKTFKSAKKTETGELIFDKNLIQNFSTDLKKVDSKVLEQAQQDYKEEKLRQTYQKLQADYILRYADINFLKKEFVFTKLKYSRCPQYDSVSGGFAALFAGFIGFLISEKFGIELVDSGDFYIVLMYALFLSFTVKSLVTNCSGVYTPSLSISPLHNIRFIKEVVLTASRSILTKLGK